MSRRARKIALIRERPGLRLIGYTPRVMSEHTPSASTADSTSPPADATQAAATAAPTTQAAQTPTPDRPSHRSDVLIVGGGIVGLATAYNLLQRRPDTDVTILEKEAELAHHQTGHNSGVLHSGLYYKPGSLKAVNCREGKKAMERFCQEHDIPYRLCGKVVVAADESEIERLDRLFERAKQNGVACELISAERCREIEPHVRVVKAIHVKETGIVDYKQVCLKLADLMKAQGCTIRTGARVTGVQRRDDEMLVQTPVGDFRTRALVNCAGLQCDRVTRMSGEKPSAKIVPFRGEYFELKKEAEHLCKTLIYPVPDPQFPFLGVHFTSMIHGGVECGPNAVLSFGREAYGKFQVQPADLFESLTYAGFLKMAAKHWRMGLGEMWRSYHRPAFVKALQRLMPEIRSEHLEPAPSGIRAQAVTPDGGLADDFIIDESQRVVNVNNAPSPAATASLNIGKLIVDKLEDKL